MLVARSLPVLPLQCIGIILALAAFAFRAPAQGAMLLVPLSAYDGGVAVRAAVDAGASLLGRGPMRGSIVVSGRRDRLQARLRHSGVLVLAAPPSACGSTISDGARA